MRTIATIVRPSDVERCQHYETADRARWDSVTAAIKASTDAETASVAYLLAGRALDDAIAASGDGQESVAARAAAYAIRNARQQLAEIAAGDREMPAGDLFSDDTPLMNIARTPLPAPDGCARWTDDDTLDAIERAAIAEPIASMLHRLRTDATAWATDGPQAGQPKSAALSGPLFGSEHRRHALRARDAYAAAIARAREDGQRVINVLQDRGSESGQRDRVARDTTTPTSGTASPVVLTDRHGQRWVTLPDVPGTPRRSVRVDDEAAAWVLRQVGMVSAYVGRGTAREADGLTLLAGTPADVSAARPIPGVGRDPKSGEPYAAWGHGAMSGTGRAYRRPVSRRRKRDGGVGGPMTRA